MSVSVPVSLLILTSTVAACGGGGDGAARVAAVQKALDAKPPSITVPRGKACELDSPVHDAEMDPKRFAHIKEVKIAPAGFGEGMLADAPCYTFTWDSSVVFGEEVIVGTNVALGRLIVDKVGDDETIGSVQAAPFRAHFEPSRLGTELIAAGLAVRPQDVPSGHATITKDADGNLVAQAQLQ